MSRLLFDSLFITSSTVDARSTACCATVVTCVTLLAISRTLASISCAALDTVCRLWSTACAAAVTTRACSLVSSTEDPMSELTRASPPAASDNERELEEIEAIASLIASTARLSDSFTSAWSPL